MEVIHVAAELLSLKAALDALLLLSVHAVMRCLDDTLV
jgi:hypothetical protein